MALKLSLEQIYASKSELEVADLKLRHDQKMEELRRTLDQQQTEQLNMILATSPATGLDLNKNLSSTVTDQYNNLIQRISSELEETFGVYSNSNTKEESNAVDKVPSVPTQDILTLLSNQQEDISSLRSRLLTEYESVLQSRADSVTEQTYEVVVLEEQMQQLQKQFEQQIETFQAKLSMKEDEKQGMFSEEKERLEQQHSEFKQSYEKHIQEIESRFEKEIVSIKEKYEEQISGLIHARLTGTTEAGGVHRDDYFHKMTTLTNIYDNQSLETAKSIPSEFSLQLKQLEADLASRDAQLKELKTRLMDEESKVSSTDSEAAGLRKQVEKLQKEASGALIQCSKLQQIIEEKDSFIKQLESEKAETQKLFKDQLLEKESPHSKNSMTKGYPSGSSMDDSFCSAMDDTGDTSRSRVGDGGEDVRSPYGSGVKGQSQEEQLFLHNKSIPFAHENVNNSYNGGSLTDLVQDLRAKVEELDKQLTEARDVEVRLRAQLEEKEHRHQEILETMEQELDHERQVEVESLQSEFKIQMEIELKRQATVLSRPYTNTNYTILNAGKTPNLDGAHFTSPIGSHSSTDNSDFSSSANTDALSSQPHAHFHNHNGDSETMSAIEYNSHESTDVSQNHLLETSEFEPQKTIQTVAVAEVLQQCSDVQGNLSDDFKVTTSNATSTTSPPPALSEHDTTALESASALPLTDFEKGMKDIMEEYESKLSLLRSELEKIEQDKTEQVIKEKQRLNDVENLLEEAEQRYDRLLEGVQNGDHPELNQLMKDKYDEELDLAKSLIQKDFDEAMKEEKKRFVERHRKVIADFIGDRGKEEEELIAKHDELITKSKLEYEDKTKGLEEQADVQFSSPSSEDNSDISTPVMFPISAYVASQYEESEERVEGQAASTLQIRTFTDVLKSVSPADYQKEKKNMEIRIQQLVFQVERLTQQLAERQSAEGVPPSPLLSPKHSSQYSQENDTLSGEDSALMAMLQSDLDRISAERERVQRTNDHLLSLLSDSVKTYVGVEDVINRKLSQVVANTPRTAAGTGTLGWAGSKAASVEHSLRPEPLGRSGSPAVNDRSDRKGVTLDGDTSQDSHTMDDMSLLSNATDEGLEISQRMAESIFVGPDLDAEGEEILTDARSRLHTAVGQLLELMERSTLQLMEAKTTQQELLDSLVSRASEVEMARQRNQELDSQLTSEIEAKEYLGLELHKAEGLISGYRSERASMDSQLQSLEEQREGLIVQLDTTRLRLEEFERSQAEIDSARIDLAHQQTLLKENAGQETQVDEQQTSQETSAQEPALLAAVTSLSKEKRDLSTKLQHQLDLSHKRLAELEVVMDESECRHEAALDEKSRALEDMGLQLDNMDRQLKASKAFVNEQIAEREQEREEHQREIERLQKNIEGKEKNTSIQLRLRTEIADLTEQLQSSIASQSDMHQHTLELQKALDDKELSAHDLKTWVSQLESELDQRGDMEDQLKQRIIKLEYQLIEKSNEQDGDETGEENPEVKITLKEARTNSPVPASPVRHGPLQCVLSLEQELQESKSVDEDILQENQVLKEQVQQQLVQISGLKNQQDQMRHYGGEEEDTDATQLRVKLQTERDTVEKKDAQITELQVKIEGLIKQLKSKAEDAESIQEKVSQILEMGDAQDENATLKVQVEELQSQLSSVSSSQHQQSLSADLLEEKNHEIEELREQVQEQGQDLTVRDEQDNQQEEKVYDLLQQLKEKDEEISYLQDNIACFKRGETCLDVSLPMADEASNVLNISMTGLTSIQQELEETMVKHEGELRQVKELLEQTQLELQGAVAERDSLRVKLNQTDQAHVVASLEDKLQLKETKLYELTMELNEEQQQTRENAENKLALESNLKEREKECFEVQEDRDKKQEQLHEKDDRHDQMILQIDSLQQEISSLTMFQHELQKDFDTVQTMMDDKEKDIESLSKEMTDAKTQSETLETVMQLERLVASLQKDLREKQNVVEEKEEELYELQDRLEEMENVKAEVETLRTELSETNISLEKEKQMKQELENTFSSEKAELEESLQKAMQFHSELEESLEQEKTKLQASRKEKYEQEQNDVIEQEKQKKLYELEIEEWKKQLKTLENDSEKKVLEFQEQLNAQSSVSANSEQFKDLVIEIENLTKELSEKESLLLQLTELVSKKEASIRTVTGQISEVNRQLEEKDKILQERDDQLQEKDKTLLDNLKHIEETHHVQRQLQETEEQLRLRQSALLDLQAEKDQILMSLEEVDSLKKHVAENEQAISEVQGQLRFRQSALLDLEAEKEKLIAEHSESEAKLKADVQEKEKELEKVQKKLKDLKEGLNEEVGHMEQELQKSSQAVLRKSPLEEEAEKRTTEELQAKLNEAFNELLDKNNLVKQIEDRLSQTSQQLSKKEDQLHQLQAEVQNFQVETAQPQVLSIEYELKVEELENLLVEADERTQRAALNAVELGQLNQALELELAHIKLKDAERTALNEMDFSMNNTHFAPPEVLSKHDDICDLIQDNEEQEALRKLLQEKENIISTLEKNIESLGRQLSVRVDEPESLRDKCHSMARSYDQDLDEKDKTIAELQEQVHFLKPTPVSASSPVKSRPCGQALSPETKEQISHLKLQLRKAHTALEEMHQRSSGSGTRTDLRDLEAQEVQELRSKIRTQFQQLSELESEHQATLDGKVRELQAQHDQDVRELRLLQERKLEQVLTEQCQRLEKQHKGELNEMKVQHQRELHRLRYQEHGDLLSEEESPTTSKNDVLPKRLQALLRRLNQLGEHLLSVSDLRYLQQHLTPSPRRSASAETERAWGQERLALMDTIDTLKDLHEQADRIALGTELDGDWRGEMVQAVVSVYDREKRTLNAEINTSDSLFPEMDIIRQLEGRLHDLGHVHQTGLDEILRADRQSLLDEVDRLHHRLLEARSNLQEARDQLSKRIAALEEAKSSAEWKLQRQIQMLEYKLQQEGVIQEDLKKSLKLEHQSVSELSSQSNQERSQTLELQSELSSTQINLSKVNDALEREQQRFTSVTDALEEERAKSIRLSQLLDSAKSHLRSAEEEAVDTDTRHQERSTSEGEYINELQSELKREHQIRSVFSDGQEKAKNEVIRLTEEVQALRRKLTSVQEDHESRLEALRREQAENELEKRLEGESEAVSQLSELLKAERSKHQARLDHERQLVRQLRHDMEQIKVENNKIGHHLEAEKMRVESLRSDLKQAHRGEQMTSLKQIKVIERDREKLRIKVHDLEDELSRVQERTRELETELNTVGQQYSENGTNNGPEYHKAAIGSHITATVVDEDLKTRLDQCCMKLQGVASQLQSMKTSSHHRRRPGTANDEDALTNVLAELNKLKEELGQREEKFNTLQNGGDCVDMSHYNQVMEHNHQLAEHIVRLKKEKTQLAMTMRTLENQIQSGASKNTQINMPPYTSDIASDEESVYGRTVWASEKLSLEMALDSAEHEIQRLRSEIKQFRGLVNSEGQLNRTDPDKSQRLYGKYLRAESFRKALIYQKKYLLLLLGGYRDTEQETIAILATMGGFPSPNAGLYHRRIHTRAFTIFRSAGRVVIAIFRMRHLVKKWKRATRVGSPVMIGQISHKHSYIPSSTSYRVPERQPVSVSQSSSCNFTSHSGSDYVESNGAGDISTVTIATTTAALYGSTARQNNYTTPPTKELTKHKTASRGNRDEARRRILQAEDHPQPSSSRSRRSDSEDDNFLSYLENVQQQLSEGEYGSSSSSRRVTWR